MANHLAQQVNLAVQNIQAHGTARIFLIGHSTGGLAIRNFMEGSHGSTPTDSEIAGVCTIGTPYNGFELTSAGEEELLLRIAHLLQMIGFGGQGAALTPTAGQDWPDSAHSEAQNVVSMLTSNRTGSIENGGGSS
jgi:triacylglycerol esterase/lipase EstA (alpha/beta hydrolase family)